MPTFCRHGRLIQNCPICSREQSVEARPLVSSGTPRTSQPRPERAAGGAGPTTSSRRRAAGGTSRAGGVRVSRLERGADDGFHSRLVPGVKSSAEAERLAAELAFAAARLARLATDPPDLYGEVAGPGDLEERTWLAFLIAYLGPLEAEDPFAEIAPVRTSWASGALPDLAGVAGGPRGVRRAAGGSGTLEAYRVWADRAGGQAAAFTGEPSWTPERRFARLFERLALPGLNRDARYELLVSLGRLGLYEIRPGTLAIGGENAVTLAAKRALAIGDPLLLERRAQILAEAAGVPLEALDLGLDNWEHRARRRGGMPSDLEPDPAVLDDVRDAFGL